MPPAFPKPKAVVFDLDGLMVNTEELYQSVGSELLGRRGRDFTPDLLNAIMGRPNHISLAIMIEWHQLDETVDQLARESEEIFGLILDARLALMPGLPSLLGAIEVGGLPKAICTSSPRRFVRRVLGPFALEPRFEFILTAEDVVEGKPAPEIYLKAAARFGLAPAEMAVLEDSQTGCRAAVAAGARTIAVPGGPSLRHDFTGAALVASSLADPRVYSELGLAGPTERA
jgi:pseudouridine 5'-phosphatase